MTKQQLVSHTTQLCYTLYCRCKVYWPNLQGGSETWSLTVGVLFNSSWQRDGKFV